MKTQRILSISVLGLALLTSAACGGSDDLSGSAVGDPGSGAAKATEEASNLNPGGGSGSGEVKPDDPQPKTGGDPESLEAAIGEHGDSERVNHQVIEETCGDSRTCLDELEDLKTYLDACADCPPSAAKFNDDVTSSQLRSGTISTAFPQAEEVQSWVEMAKSPDANAGDDAGDYADSDLGGAAEELANRLQDMPADEPVDWVKIVEEMDPANRDALSDKLEEVFVDMADSNPTMKDLLDGSQVPAADAVVAINDARESLD